MRNRLNRPRNSNLHLELSHLMVILTVGQMVMSQKEVAPTETIRDAEERMVGMRGHLPAMGQAALKVVGRMAISEVAQRDGAVRGEVGLTEIKLKAMGHSFHPARVGTAAMAQEPQIVVATN